MIRHRHALALAVVAAVLVSVQLGRAAEVDPYLPDDSEIVVNINVRQILDSALIKKKLLEMAQEALRGNDQVQDVLKELELDPFKDLDRVLIASPGGGEKDRGLIVVHGRFKTAKFKAKADEEAKNNGDHLKIHKVLGGKHLLYEVNVPEADDPLFVALADEKTLLVSPGKDYVIDALKKTNKEAKPAPKEASSSNPAKTSGVAPLDKAVLKNKKFQALLAKLDDRQSVSLAMVKNPDLKKSLDNLPGDVKAMIDKVQALGGGLTISDEVKMELVVTTKNARDAGDLRDSAKAGVNLILLGLAALTQNDPSPEAEFLNEIVKSLRVTSNGQAVVVKGRISSDLIEDTIKKKSK